MFRKHFIVAISAIAGLCLAQFAQAEIEAQKIGSS